MYSTILLYFDSLYNVITLLMINSIILSDLLDTAHNTISFGQFHSLTLCSPPCSTAVNHILIINTFIRIRIDTQWYTQHTRTPSNKSIKIYRRVVCVRDRVCAMGYIVPARGSSVSRRHTGKHVQNSTHIERTHSCSHWPCFPWSSVYMLPCARFGECFIIHKVQHYRQIHSLRS